MPGKFASTTDEYAYGLALDCPEDTIGDVQWCHAWQAIVIAGNDEERQGLGGPAAIVSQDSRGFVDVDYYDFTFVAQREWKDVRFVHKQPGGCCNDDDEDGFNG